MAEAIKNSGDILDYLRRIVEDSGGTRTSTQYDLLRPDSAVLILRNPTTGHDLAVPFNPLSFIEREIAGLVRAKINADNIESENRTVSVKVSALMKLAETLSNASAELNALCARRK